MIGFDQSEERLKKAPAALAQQTNACLIRAEASDLWRLFHLEGWLFQKAPILSNPWPKVGHLKRRVHGHPVFPIMLALSEETELRASWDIYAQEFAEAATILGFQNFGPDRINPQTGISSFEKIHRITNAYIPSDGQAIACSKRSWVNWRRK